MQSTSYNNDASWQPWLVVSVAFLLSQQQQQQSPAIIEQFYWLVDHALVPLYTLGVLAYLSALVIQRHVVPEVKQRTDASKQKQGHKQKQKDALESDVGTVMSGEDAEQPIDMTGKYKLVSVENFDKFLAIQGVPYFLRQAACKARPVHRITHRGNRVTIRIEGIIVTQTTYVIGGPPVEVSVRGRKFQDRMVYLENGKGIQGIKEAVTENYNVFIDRELSEDRQKITLTSRAIFKDDRETVESVQIFERLE
ncbi:expressed unknown protein [Seminavis robusta]|uniref:Uncharacterized protein n=1 Tax=Seminavis robusta TaxID=568900 RepID=A0A9N8F0K7_9STRA|nr:expressed unknown protein [Seminavis robusta]|eukprot:Sro2162_g317180.1 n/a (252) ;mRNA; r:9078-9917